MKIAVFGGTFDPPHLGHSRIAQEMISNQLVDEVWFVPVYRHPWADRLEKLRLAEYKHRKKMLKLILTKQTKIEEYLDSDSYSSQNLLDFAKRYPQHEFTWVMGADNLPDFSEWEDYQVIIDFGTYVYPRKGFELKTDLKGMTLLTDFPEVVASSTEIKRRLSSGESISELVDPRVEAYIQQHRLYQ